ncbi:hypothetical protein ISCGN_013088 [Ixodes scapularis]
MPFRANTTATAIDRIRSACKAKVASEVATRYTKRYLGTHIGGSTGSVMRLRVFPSEAMTAGRRQPANPSNACRHLTWTSLVNRSHTLFSHAGQTEFGSTRAKYNFWYRFQVVYLLVSISLHKQID